MNWSKRIYRLSFTVTKEPILSFEAAVVDNNSRKFENVISNVEHVAQMLNEEQCHMKIKRKSATLFDCEMIRECRWNAHVLSFSHADVVIGCDSGDTVTHRTELLLLLTGPSV